MKGVLETMLCHGGDRRHVFVFPSEVAAEWALVRLLEHGGRRVLPRDVCISWDSFKERTLSGPAGTRPVDNVARTLFSQALLEENASAPFFSAIINPAYAHDARAFLPWLRRVLPGLEEGLDLVRRAGERIRPAKARDLSLLHARYTRFLAEAGLHEPDASPAAFDPRGCAYTIFHPEVITDWRKTEPVLRGHPAVTVFSLPASGAPAGGLTVFNDRETETDQVLLRVHELLAAGVGYSRVALTVAGLSAFAPALADAARRFDIRLRVNEGAALIDFPGVSFLNRAARVIASGFDLRAVESLLGDAALPWKKELPAAALVRFGLEHNCLGNYPDGNGVFDLWESRFRGVIAAGGTNAVRARAPAALYRSLRTNLTRLARAASFTDLKKAVTVFRSVFLEDAFPSPAAGRNFDLALRRLDELTERSRRLPLPPPASPFGLWLDLLRDTHYVPPAPGPGLAVYPYRVSAGIMPDYHFVLNVCEELVRVPVRPYLFLSVDEEARLNLAETDASDAFLRLYLVSGREVSLSFSRQSGGTVRLPPPFFVKTGAVKEPDGPATVDPYAREARAFTDAGAAPPPYLFSLQRQGLSLASAVPAPSREEMFTLCPVSPPSLLESVLKAVMDQEGRIALTPTDLETFQTCAFRYLLTKAAGWRAWEHDFAQDDRRWYGTFIHRTLELFFRGLMETGDRLSPGRLPSGREVMHAALAAAEAEKTDGGTLPVPPLWEAMRDDLLPGLNAFLEKTVNAYGECEIKGVEYPLNRVWEKERISLAGTVDLMLATGFGTALVDYKIKYVPGKKDLAPVHGAPVSLQIPCYLLLAAEHGNIPAAAAYYSFEDRTYVHVCHPQAKKRYFGAGEIKAVVERTEETVLLTANKIRQGDFTGRGTDAGSCRACPLRAVCRRKYHLLARN